MGMIISVLNKSKAHTPCWCMKQQIKGTDSLLVLESPSVVWTSIDEIVLYYCQGWLAHFTAWSTAEVLCAHCALCCGCGARVSCRSGKHSVANHPVKPLSFAPWHTRLANDQPTNPALGRIISAWTSVGRALHLTVRRCACASGCGAA